MEKSQLNKLPAELRNTIYQFAMLSEHGLPLRTPEPALTQACRQLRAESLQLYYTTETFYINMPGVRSRADGLMDLLVGWTGDDGLAPTAFRLIKSLPKHHVRKMKNVELRAEMKLVFISIQRLPTIAEIPVREWFEICQPLAEAGFDLRQFQVKLASPQYRNMFSMAVAPIWAGGEGKLDALKPMSEIVALARKPVEIAWKTMTAGSVAERAIT